MEHSRYNELTGIILDASIEVHRVLGPGLLESVYLFALSKELELRGIQARKLVGIELLYKGYPTGKMYEMDLLVEDEIVVELKAVETLLSVFEAQLISYLRLAKKKAGLLINFNVPLLKNGFKRFVNNF
jgi:GxxExxY protein